MEVFEKKKELAKKEGNSIYRIAKDLGISHGTIDNWRSRGVEPLYSTVKKIYSHLNYEPKAIDEFSTCEIVEELVKREGIEQVEIKNVEDEFQIIINGKRVQTEVDGGVCRIVIIWD